MVLVTVFAKELHERQELLPLGFRGRALGIRGADQVLAFDDVAEGRSEPVVAHERIQRRRQLRAVLAHGDGEVAARAHGHVFVNAQIRKDLLPEVRQIVVNDDGRNQPRVHHLDQVVVLEVLRRGANHDRRLPLGLEPVVEREQALMVAARFADEDLLSRQGVNRGNRGTSHRR